MFYTEKCEPRLGDYTGKGKLSFEALLQILENVGTHHSVSVGDSLTDGSVAWMIIDWRIEIKRKPRMFEKIAVTTWSRGKFNSFTSGREFSVCTEGGDPLIYIGSKFALVDVKEKKMAKITDELVEMYKPEAGTTNFETEAGKLSVPESFDFEMPVVMRRGDFDFNGHVHNTKYLVYAMEALPYEDYAADDFRSLRIIYRSSLKFGDEAVVKRKAMDGGYSFCIFSGETLCTIIEMKR